MGPADSEPLLISLAAELEAVNGWVTKQPEPWWLERAEGAGSGALA
jgi:amidase